MLSIKAFGHGVLVEHVLESSGSRKDQPHAFGQSFFSSNTCKA